MSANTFTVTLTEAELKAFEYVAVSPQDWIDNVVHERCRHAIDEIFQMEVKRMLEDPSIKEIPADREAVVLAAIIKSAAQREAEFKKMRSADGV